MQADRAGSRKPAALGEYALLEGAPLPTTIQEATCEACYVNSSHSLKPHLCSAVEELSFSTDSDALDLSCYAIGSPSVTSSRAPLVG